MSRRGLEPALFFLALAVSFCGVNETGETPASAGEAFETPFCSVILPGRWTEEPSGDPDRWVFARGDGAARLTVSGMSDPQGRVGAELEGAVREVAELRREVERQVSGGATEVEPVVMTRRGQFVVARYEASEPSRSREASAYLIARPGVILTFYLETVGSSREDLETLGQAVFDSVTVK